MLYLPYSHTHRYWDIIAHSPGVRNHGLGKAGKEGSRMRLSIIIPLYKTAAYLPACLDSVVSLPAAEVEILAVDDCSPDDCAAIAAEYAAQRENFRLLRHEQNRGLSATRNTALAAARGDYILFLDSDDLLVPSAVLPLLAQAEANQLDILQAAYTRFADDGNNTPLPTPPPAEATGIMPGSACLAAQCAAGSYEPMTVLRLYRRAFLQANRLEMAEGLLFEDELFTAPAFLAAKRAQVSEAVLYRYRQRPGSIMASFQKNAAWCGHQLEICRRLADIAQTPPPSAGKRALGKRAAAIALSIAKNIPAYDLTGDVQAEALAFVRAHRVEICALAQASDAPLLQAQGLLLKVSVPGFLKLYETMGKVLRRGG